MAEVDVGAVSCVPFSCSSKSVSQSVYLVVSARPHSAVRVEDICLLEATPPQLAGARTTTYRVPSTEYRCRRMRLSLGHVATPGHVTACARK